MRHIPLVLAVLLLVGTAHAQHCEFDMTSCAVLDVRDARSGEAISDLRITLLDSSGAPLLGYDNQPRRFRDMTRPIDTSAKEREAVMSGRENYDRSRQREERDYGLFWFARGRYVYTGGPSPRTVLIEDTSGRGYPPLTVVIDRADIFHLCLDATDWYQELRGEFARTFRPVPVWNLKRGEQAKWMR